MKKIYSLKLFCSTLILLGGSLISVGQDITVTTTSVCRFMSDPDNTRTVISYIPAGTEITVLGTKGDYYLVEYEESQGYISAEKVKVNQAEQDYSEPAGNIQDNEPDYKSADFQKARYDILVEKYGEKTARALFNHKIWKGINHNMVRDSWGKPLEVKRTATESGVTDEWIYKKTRLVFINDVLTYWGPVK